MINHVKLTKEIDLHTRISRMEPDKNVAENELVTARFQLDLLEGQLADAKGDYGSARIHYANALAVADRITSPALLARLHEALGIMESRFAHVEAAVEHFKKAGEYHTRYGNIVCGTGQSNTNVSYTYLAKRKYQEAIEPGEKAYQFFQSINHAYWLAINEANLAEANFYVGRLADATSYAESGLRREIASVRPYCLYVLGHVARVGAEYQKAENLCLQAIASAKRMKTPGRKRRPEMPLGEALRDAGRVEEATESFESALAIWERMKIDHEVVYTRGLMESVIGGQ